MVGFLFPQKASLYSLLSTENETKDCIFLCNHLNSTASAISSVATLLWLFQIVNSDICSFWASLLGCEQCPASQGKGCTLCRGVDFHSSVGAITLKYHPCLGFFDGYKFVMQKIFPRRFIWIFTGKFGLLLWSRASGFTSCELLYGFQFTCSFGERWEVIINFA